MNSRKNAKLTAKGREEMARRMEHHPAPLLEAVFSSLAQARLFPSSTRQAKRFIRTALKE